MIEKMKTSQDNKQFCAAILKGFSKAYDCICYNLLVAKLRAYGFDKKTLKFTYDCLKGSLRKLKWVLHSVVNCSCILQGPILGPL